jgi:uroporphyrinogen decarboxylase
MKKRQRVEAALRGEPVDRVPCSLWYHFGLQHMPGAVHAQAELDFFRAYDLDWLKVMNDYTYRLPDGMPAVQKPDDWRRLEPWRPAESGFAEQLEAMAMIRQGLGREAMSVDTVFNPWTTAVRMATLAVVLRHAREAPGDLLSGLGVIARTLADYAAESIARGADGIFMSVTPDPSVLSPDEFERFVKPFDLQVFGAVRDAGRFNVLHIHGMNPMFERLLDYPVHAINWSHRTTAPSLAEGRRLYAGCILGGIDESTYSRVTPPMIHAQVTDALATAGARKFMLTPGCSVPTDTAVRNLRALRDGLDRAGRAEGSE